MEEKRRLIYDIETSPNVILDFSCGYNKNVAYHQVIEERQVICICWKWEGEGKIYHLDWGKDRNDKPMLQKFAKVLAECTEAVAHNGDKFDIKWLKGRFLKHRIPFSPFLKTIDTYRISKKHFNLNSHSLNYLGQYLKVGKKVPHSGFDLWKDLMLYNKKKDRDMMIKYCKGDIELLEKVYKTLKNYTEPTMHYGVKAGEKRYSCPECGSHKIRYKDRHITKMGSISHYMNCKECDKHYKISDSVYLKYLKNYGLEK